MWARNSFPNCAALLGSSPRYARCETPRGEVPGIGPDPRGHPGGKHAGPGRACLAALASERAVGDLGRVTHSFREDPTHAVPATAPRAVPPADAERLGLLEAVVQQAPTFLHVVRGPDFVFEFVNPAYEQVVGRRDLIGRSAFEAVPEAMADGEYARRAARVMATREPFVGRELPVTLARTPGAPPEERLIDLVYLPLVEPDGTCERVLGHGTDVTDQVRARRAAEQALRASEARQTFLLALSDALRALDDPIAVEGEACRRLGERLGADRAYYVAVDEAAGVARVARDWVRDAIDAASGEAAGGGAPSLAGEHRVADFGWSVAILRRGACYSIPDTQTSPLVPPAARPAAAALRIVACIGAPLVKRGHLVGALCVTAAGARAWADDEVQLVRDVGERIWAAVERARAEAALRASEARVRALVEHLPDYAIYGLDAEGVVTAWTAGAERVKGYAAGEIVGRPLATFYTPEDVAAGVPARELAEAAATGRFEGEGWRVRKGGARFWGNEIATAVRAAAADGVPGRLVGFTKITRDLTERRRAEAAVRASLAEAQTARAEAEAARGAAEAARAAAEAADQAKSQFLAVMSHELRTPLNAIGGYAELLELGIRGPVTDQQRADLGRIQTSQRHLLGLINEVLNYAKLGTGTVHYDAADVRACDALAAAEQLVAPQARAKGLTLDVPRCADAVVVRADPDKLRQVLVNLLSNAVKFTDRGGRVELTCGGTSTEAARPEGTHPGGSHPADAGVAGATPAVRFTVRDTGIGIAADQLARVFEPFVQVRSDLTRTAEGTGLGLAISRDLARGMGGDLTAESTPGVGSTFSLTLPPA